MLINLNFTFRLDYPILITNNQFTNNFGSYMALNILIFKIKASDKELACYGIDISSNTFKDNYGCYNSIGNVAVMCKPQPAHVKANLADQTFIYLEEFY